MKNSRSRIVILGTSFFALFGAVATSYFGPKAIAWYFDPPVDIGVNCRSAVEWSMAQLQKLQLIGFVTGTVLGLLAMVWLTGRRNRNLKN